MTCTRLLRKLGAAAGYLVPAAVGGVATYYYGSSAESWCSDVFPTALEQVNSNHSFAIPLNLTIQGDNLPIIVTGTDLSVHQFLPVVAAVVNHVLNKLAELCVYMPYVVGAALTTLFVLSVGNAISNWLRSHSDNSKVNVTESKNGEVVIQIKSDAKERNANNSHRLWGSGRGSGDYIRLNRPSDERTIHVKHDDNEGLTITVSP